MIGRISVSADGELVRISYLDFWGRRQNHVHSRDNVVPLDEIDDPPNDYYVRYRLYDEPKRRFRYSIRFGNILDAARFATVVGQGALPESLKDAFVDPFVSQVSSNEREKSKTGGTGPVPPVDSGREL